jgi:UDP-N-acetylmuramoyl-tripeptide--D-alanyl-D-alanine ligase
LGQYQRKRFKGTVIGITGSVGKTSTRGMFEKVLQTQGAVYASQKSYNNHIGVPLTLANLPLEVDIAFCLIIS